LLPNEHEVIIPQIWAEEDNSAGDLHSAIVAHERDQHSTGEPGSHGQRPAAAEQSSVEPSLLDLIEQTVPLATDESRKKFDEARNRQEGDESEEELEEIEEAEGEEGAPPSPLDAFDDNLVQQLLEKLGITPEEAQNPAVANLLAEKLQGEQQSRMDQAQQQREPQTEQEHYQAYMSELQRVASDPQINDPVMMAAFENTLAQCFGADSPEAQGNVKNLSTALVQGGLSLMSTVVPAMLNHYFAQALEATLPGLAQQHFDGVAKSAWDAVLQDPQYRELPALDSDEFSQLREDVLQKNPWMTTIAFKDAQGRNLHPDHPQAIRQQAKLFARLATGERLSPDMVAKAVARGKREAQGHTRRVSASRSLASGRSHGASAFGSQSKDTSFTDAIHEWNRSQHSGENYED
jgi:hypothetical protein